MRLEVKTAGLEIGGEAEVMEVTKATRNALSHLEETVNGFDRGIRQAGFQVGQDAVEMFFESSREFAERFEPRTVGPAQPPADGKQVAIGQLIFLRKRGLDSCFLVEVDGLSTALEALW